MEEEGRRGRGRGRERERERERESTIPTSGQQSMTIPHKHSRGIFTNIGYQLTMYILWDTHHSRTPRVAVIALISGSHNNVYQSTNKLEENTADRLLRCTKSI